MENYFDTLPVEIRWIIWSKKIEHEAQEQYHSVIHQLKILGKAFRIKKQSSARNSHSPWLDAQRYVDTHYRYMNGKYFARRSAPQFYFHYPLTRKQLVDYIMCQDCFARKFSICKDHEYMYYAFDL